MGLLESMKTVLASPTPKSRPDDGSKGAYWCDDCSVRIRDIDLEKDSAEDKPTCPNCGDEMRFERSSGRNCAC